MPCLHALLAWTALLTPGESDVVIYSKTPTYELTLPSSYDRANPPERPPRFVRNCGLEYWARVHVTVVNSPIVLNQDLSGVTAEQILPIASLPPDSKWTFSRLQWKDFDIGSFEYRAVVNNLPVIGLSAVLPLKDGSVTITAYAPEPHEKECREDFKEILARMAQARSHWQSPEYYRKVRTMDRIGMAGAALTLAYPIAWIFFFRGNPMLAHWLRTLWLVVAALLLFIPISSPGETTALNNLMVNGLMPVLLVSAAARRVKLGIEME